MSEITWYGHSAFKISAPQAHVVIDPFFTPASGVNAESLGPVDMVLVTHDLRIAEGADRVLTLEDGLVAADSTSDSEVSPV